MHWNHRVMIRHYEHTDETTLGIREVFYEDDGSIAWWTVDDIAPQGDHLQELRSELEQMLECLSRPLLDEKLEEERSKRRAAAREGSS